MPVPKLFLFTLYLLAALAQAGQSQPSTVQLEHSRPLLLAGLPADERSQLNSSIAAGRGDNFLVVWQQGRSYFQGQGADILAVKVAGGSRPSAGSVMQVCVEAGSQEHPQTASNDGMYLVVWQDLRNGSDWDIYGTRISGDGRVLDPGGFLIAGGRHNQALPSLTTRPDSGFLVVWQDFSGGQFYELRAANVNHDGSVTNSQTLEYTGPDAGQWQGYTPGWGIGRLPLGTGLEDSMTLKGGRVSVARLKDSWLLSWHDETNWAPGQQGHITRRYARFDEDDDQFRVVEMGRAISIADGRSGGRFASGLDTVIFTGWALVHRGNSIATATVLGPGSLSPLNYTKADLGTGAGIKKYEKLSVFDFKVPVDGPVAAAYHDGKYLVAAAGQKRTGKAQANNIYGRLIDASDGISMSGPTDMLLHEGGASPANPSLAGGGGGFLLAYDEVHGGGPRRVFVKSLTVK